MVEKLKERSDFYSWLRVFGILKSYWFFWFVILVLTALNTALAQLNPQIQKNLVDIVTSKGTGQFFGFEISFVTLLVIALLVLVFETVLNRLINAVSARVNVRTRQDLRRIAYSQLLYLPVEYFNNSQTGKIMSRINRGTMDINSMISYLLSGLLPNILTILFSLVLVSVSNKYIGGAVVVAYLPYMIFRYIRFKLRKPIQEKQMNLFDTEAGRFVQALMSIRLVKAFAGEKNEVRIYQKYTQKIIRTVDKLVRLENRFVIANLYSDLITWLTYAYSAYLGYTGQISAGEVILLIGYVRMIKTPLMSLDSLWWQISDATVGAEEYLKILDQDKELEVKEGGNIEFVDGDIVLDKISFGYGKDKKIFDDLSLTIDKGQSVAIVGVSGSGKSTLVNLLLRFFDLSGGKITIGGIDIAQIRLAELRKKIGVVFQDTYLFDETVFSNVNYDGRYSKSAVIRALKEANAWEFVEKLPKKMYTVLGERGVKLSGGQKQRLSIARTLLIDPPILIFDEATSSLDTVSEKLIQESLEKIRKNRTVIIIAHRLSTVKNADNIFVLSEGQVVEEGTHMELMRKKKVYATLVRQQAEMKTNQEKIS